MGGLQKTTVIDLTAYVAGPACARIMGDLGAEVIKVEPFGGDEMRTQGMAWGMKFRTEFDDVAMDCTSFNKRWVSINLKTEDGHAFMMKMLEKADILLTSYRDKALEHLGLDYETLHEKFPRLVFGQMRGYGEYGPMKDAKGFDATSFAARSGFVHAIPQANEHFEPGNSPIAFGDWNASNALAVGVLAAYANALKTGEGDKVTTSLYHVGTWGMTAALVAQQQGCDYPKDRMMAKCPTNNSYVSADGIWFLMCFGHYNRYCKLVFETLEMDSKYWSDPEYNNLETLAQNGNYVEVTAAIHKACMKWPYAELEKRFRENDIPFEKIQSVKDVLHDEEAFANAQLRRVKYDDGQGYGEDNSYTITTTPYRLKSIGDPVLRRSKPIGYDTKEVALEYGYSAQDVERMVSEGAVLVYDGKPVPDAVLEPSYGIHSLR